MISYLSTSLVLVGLVIHLAALFPLRRLIAILPVGSLRNKWFAMSGLIFIFIAGYLAYIILFWNQQNEWNELTIPFIFLFGAVFVWLTIELSLQTAVDLRRIEVLKTENVTDSLTKVYNRRYLERRIDEEIARSIRYSFNLSILMLDIDHFKQVNDIYGHQAGDVTLFNLSALVKKSLRDTDVIARYGGEEFLVICPNTDVNSAAMLAERLRQLVESHPVEFVDTSGVSQSIQISISVGVAGLSAIVSSKEKLVQAADQALYRAKSEGGNRVVIAAA